MSRVARLAGETASDAKVLLDPSAAVRGLSASVTRAVIEAIAAADRGDSTARLPPAGTVWPRAGSEDAATWPALLPSPKAGLVSIP